MKRKESVLVLLVVSTVGLLLGAIGLGLVLGGCSGCDRAERIPAQVERLPNRWGSMRVREMRELRKKVI